VKKLGCLLMLPATLILSASLSAKDNSVSKPEAEEGWILLFDGESLMGWTAQTGTPWRIDGGSLEPTADAGFLAEARVSGAEREGRLQRDPAGWPRR
jgi:hypothetical protein